MGNSTFNLDSILTLVDIFSIHDTYNSLYPIQPTLTKILIQKLENLFGHNCRSHMTFLSKDLINLLDLLLDFKFHDKALPILDNFCNKKLESIPDIIIDQVHLIIEKRIKNLINHITVSNEPISTLNHKQIIPNFNELFHINPLIQYLDQINTLSEFMHKMKITKTTLHHSKDITLRDIKRSELGKLCLIDTNEGLNSGLNVYLPHNIIQNKDGYLETLYQETIYDNIKLKPLINTKFTFIPESSFFSLAENFIPFFFYNDPTRSLMGSKMQMQSVPLIYKQNANIITGKEQLLSRKTSNLIYALQEGIVTYSSSYKINIRDIYNREVSYYLINYNFSNQNTVKHSTPIVWVGERVTTGQLLAVNQDFEGNEFRYDFEDALILNQTVIKNNLFASLHMDIYESPLEVLSNQMPEFTSKKIPKYSYYVKRNLNSFGIIKEGSKVLENDLLIAKCTINELGYTKKSLQQFLFTLFGSRLRNIKDTSISLSVGNAGRVVKIEIITDKKLLNHNSYLKLRFFIIKQRLLEVGLLYNYLKQSNTIIGSQFNSYGAGKIIFRDGRTDKIHYRTIGPYSSVIQQPIKGRSKKGGQRFGEMEVWALEAFGAAYNLKELLSIKSDDIKGPSKDQICEWATRYIDNIKIKGEVTEPLTINFKKGIYEKNGLFCEKIFGPVVSWKCKCGLYKGRILYFSNQNKFCEQCGSELNNNIIRRYRMGYITLITPIVHIWYLKGPEYIKLIKNKSFNDIIIPKNDKYEWHYSQEMISTNLLHTKLKNLNLLTELQKTRDHLILTNKLHKRSQLSKKIRILNCFFISNIKPEWIFLEVLPIIPPQLRPFTKLTNNLFISSPINNLYRLILIRNNRLKRWLQLRHFIPLNFELIEKKMLQQSVDNLFSNKLTQKTNYNDNRPIFSLSTALSQGKYGRFRQNLLGKRIDFSGRSVIISGADLPIGKIGLPYELAFNLFNPLLQNIFQKNNKLRNLFKSIALLQYRPKIIKSILKQVLTTKVILMNRAPTLHKMNIQAFKPYLIEQDALKLFPLSCSSFNADFDGDQMGIFLPLSKISQYEAKYKLLSDKNYFSFEKNKNLFKASQNMILDYDDLLQAYFNNLIELNSFIWVKKVLKLIFIGYVSNIQGILYETPIMQNFSKGLNLYEYFISCYGARKGIIDTAIKTADSGYLTRRLIEISRDIVIKEFNCGTKAKLYYLDNLELSGRTICNTCYNYQLASNKNNLGDSVGILAAQSIGEPATQLTLRTFHTGGVFTKLQTQKNKSISFNTKKSNLPCIAFKFKIFTEDRANNIRFLIDQISTQLYDDKQCLFIKKLLIFTHTNQSKLESKSNDQIKSLLVQRTSIVSGGSLTQVNGYSPHQNLILESLFKQYITHGINLPSIHFELIIKKMTSCVKILSIGDTAFKYNEIIPFNLIHMVNMALTFHGYTISYYKPQILGISKAILASSASFQETLKTLINSALDSKVDWITDLKTRIMFADLITAGSGSSLNSKYLIKKAASLTNQYYITNKISSGLFTNWEEKAGFEPTELFLSYSSSDFKSDAIDQLCHFS
ncbi:putative Rna polymerase C1 [Cardiosporidium cionae]|uniref:DNA-directed RNA polymerase subunit n=1 Tax=Cardiosporidium cionae TaxID=476202 RepID=A0ABQ7J604_9APIC|nr:putative Rna polymerase C1 [Cardiosporidium cionae]|eukprot:KAF8819411.1 putative Rna polymerase C1 [Cardiosporidium cionae]